MGLHNDTALPTSQELRHVESLSSTEKVPQIHDVKEKTDVESFGDSHEDVDETIIKNDEDVALQVRLVASLHDYASLDLAFTTCCVGHLGRRRPYPARVHVEDGVLGHRSLRVYLGACHDIYLQASGECSLHPEGIFAPSVDAVERHCLATILFDYCLHTGHGDA